MYFNIYSPDGPINLVGLRYSRATVWDGKCPSGKCPVGLQSQNRFRIRLCPLYWHSMVGIFELARRVLPKIKKALPDPKNPNISVNTNEIGTIINGLCSEGNNTMFFSSKADVVD